MNGNPGYQIPSGTRTIQQPAYKAFPAVFKPKPKAKPKPKPKPKKK